MSLKSLKWCCGTRQLAYHSVLQYKRLEFLRIKSYCSNGAYQGRYHRSADRVGTELVTAVGPVITHQKKSFKRIISLNYKRRRQAYLIDGVQGLFPSPHSCHL